MSVKVQLKHSAVKDKAPVAADLSAGELALNINDQSPAAYIKDSAGNIVKIAGAGALGGVWKRNAEGTGAGAHVALSPNTTGDTVQISAGTEALPGLTPVGDPNTGVWAPAADTVAVSTNGVERLRITADGKIGVRTKTPATKLDIQDTSATTNAPVAIQNIGALSSGTVANGFGPAIRFYGQDASGSNRDMAYVSSIYTNAGAVSTALTFYTRDKLGALTEKVRIDEQGRVGIGPNGTGGYDVLFNHGNSSSPLVRDASGRLLVGVSSSARVVDAAFQGGAAAVPGTQVESTDSIALSSLGLNRNDSFGPLVALVKSRGTSSGEQTLVNAEDCIGGVSFNGTDGSATRPGAVISAYVDGTPGANDMPGRIGLFTTPSGGTVPLERMRVKSTGIVNITNAPTYADNTAATAGGLVAGDIYRKADGTLMITF